MALDVGGEAFALWSRSYDATQAPQRTQAKGLSAETNKRAAVNRRPAVSKRMRSGSPSVSLLELGGRLVYR